MIKVFEKLYMISRFELLNLKNNNSKVQNKKDKILNKQKRKLFQKFNSFKCHNLNFDTSKCFIFKQR